MKLSQFIINDIKPLFNTDLIGDVQLLFNQLTYSHIPIKNKDGIFLGCLSENDAHCFETTKDIQKYIYAVEGFFVRDTTNWLDVLESFTQNSTNIMPILNAKNKYLGYYELKDVISLFSETPFFAEAGGILIIEKGVNDYSFSEISQIVESNNGKLLGAFISSFDNDLARITLKISNIGLNDVMQTFRRYSYNIVSGFEEDTYIENLKDRSDYLNKYLNM